MYLQGGQWVSETVSERKQDSSSQTMPVGDEADPPEGSEEAAEPRTDTPGEGAAGPLEGMAVGASG